MQSNKLNGGYWLRTKDLNDECDFYLILTGYRTTGKASIISGLVHCRFADEERISRYRPSVLVQLGRPLSGVFFTILLLLLLLSFGKDQLIRQSDNEMENNTLNQMR